MYDYLRRLSSINQRNVPLSFTRDLPWRKFNVVTSARGTRMTSRRMSFIFQFAVCRKRAVSALQ